VKHLFPWAIRLLVLVLLAGVTHSALATDTDMGNLRLSGYGTLGYVGDNHKEIATMRDVSQTLSEGYKTGNSWKVDSRLDLQVDYRFSPTVEAVAQAVLRDQVVKTLDTTMELAYVGVATAPDWTVRLGRLGLDVFLMSDHRNLGYAYNWVRPPQEYYSWLPVFSLDGLDVTYKTTMNNANWRIKAQLGQSEPSIAMGASSYQADVDKLFILSAQREAGPWRLKAGYAFLHVNNEVGALALLHTELDKVAGLNLPQISAEAASLRANAGFYDASKHFLSFGAAYDDGEWLGQAEVGMSKTDTAALNASRLAYVVLGRRVGNFTPFALLATSRPNISLVTPINDWGRISPASASALRGLQNSAVYVANSTRMDQESLSLGVRWDFHDQAAFKLQWSSSHIHQQGYGIWARAPHINDQDSRVNSLSASLDFVF
jgi:hypothetical protein